MSIRVEKHSGMVEFITDGHARLCVYQDDHAKFLQISTEGVWYVSKTDIDQMIAILTTIRGMLDGKS